jgi:hypothetical protein
VAAPAASTGAPPAPTLDGFGQLTPPPLRAAPLPDKVDSTVPGPDHPPGYYGPSGAARAFNLITARTVLKPLRTIEGSAVSGYTLKKPMALEPWLYLAAIALFAADILALLVLSGGFRLRRRAAATARDPAARRFFPSPDSRAQDNRRRLRPGPVASPTISRKAPTTPRLRRHRRPEIDRTSEKACRD